MTNFPGTAVRSLTRGIKTALRRAIPARFRLKILPGSRYARFATQFTGARLNEILSLEWSYINWGLGFARLPESKTGAKNLPLPNPALAILRKIRENRGQKEQDNKYVFPGDRPNSYFKGIQKPWRRIRTAAGLNNVRLHDLRHCYASTAVSGGESLYLVGSILGHRQAVTTQRYAHLAMTPILEVANRTAGRLVALLKPAPLSRSFPGQGDS